MPNPTKDVDAIIATPPPPASKLIATTPGDPWPGVHTVGPDPSRVDRIAQQLKAKLETISNYDEPERVIKKIFADADVDGSNCLDEDEFVKVMTGKLNFFGCEADVRQLFRRFDIDRSGKLDITEFHDCLYQAPGSRATTCIGKIREVLAKRAGGTTTLKSMALQFKIMDTDKSGNVDRREFEVAFEKFTRAFGINITKYEFDELFKSFDVDKSGSVTYDEFLRGVRGGMNEFRLNMVKMAFGVLDDTNDGLVTLEDIARKYDVSKNPLVKAGKMSPNDVLKAFMTNWHLAEKGHKDGVTLEDFVEYYEWISPSIDRDDYFELMIRNAWHISGGEGWSANTSNIRVLVEHTDGSETVEEVKNDIGLRRDDAEGIKRRLIAQGITDIKAISLK
jgi:Ca2+-binding EF-hand superfamily protein